jgi:hypothetical protein
MLENSDNSAPLGDLPSEKNEQEELDGCIKVSRRTFYSLLFAGAVGGVASYISFSEKSDIPDIETLAHRAYDRALESKSSELWTLGESVLFSVAQEALARGLDRLNIRHGANAYVRQDAIAPPETRLEFLWDLVKKNGLAPILEEAIFRLAPAVFTKDAEMSWVTGMTANTFFSLIHNIDFHEDGNFLIHYKSLPILQFILGSYCWYLMKSRGFSHAVAAHATYNCLMNILPRIAVGNANSDDNK